MQTERRSSLNLIKGAPRTSTQSSSACCNLSGTLAPSLQTLPLEWLPTGAYSRGFQARSGLLTLTGGRTGVERTAQRIRFVTPQGEYSLRPDPEQPGRVVAETPRGSFAGTLSRQADRVTLRTPHGSLSLQRREGYLRLDAPGLSGHLRLLDR